MTPGERSGATRADKPAPVLSIIMPVLDEASNVPHALQALQPLRRRGVEVIVADGGSGDDTMRRARPLADQVISAPRGRGAQMNEGAKAARGFIFLFLPVGARLPDDADSEVMYGRGRDTSVWGRFDLRLDGRHMLLPLVARFVNWRSRASGIALGDQAIFVQRETFFQIGGFADIALMEDVEISRRLNAISPPICVTSRVTVPGRRWDEQGLWTTAWTLLNLHLRYHFGADPSELARRYGREAQAAQAVSPDGSARARTGS